MPAPKKDVRRVAIAITLNPLVHGAVKRLSESRYQTMSEFIERALEAHFASLGINLLDQPAGAGARRALELIRAASREGTSQPQAAPRNTHAARVS